MRSFLRKLKLTVVSTALAVVLSAPAFAGDVLPSTSVPSPMWAGSGNTAAAGAANFDSGYRAPRTPSVIQNLSAVVVTTAATVWTPSNSAVRFRVTGFCLTQGVVTGALTFKDGANTAFIVPQHTLGQAQCFTFPGNGYVSTADNNALTVIGASTETVTGFVIGNEEP